MQRIPSAVFRTGALALALVLAGCGGGGGGTGGGNSTPPPPDNVVPQRDIHGTAAKGLIKGAKVSVYALDAQGVRASTATASATTGTDGTYQMQVPVSMRNFVIEVSAAPGAMMADEATGTDIAIPGGMALRSVVTLADNATGAYQGTVSPLTEMVAQTAQTADGKLPPQAVAQAKAGVRTLFGFDPEVVKPVNSNSAAAANASEDEKNQSLALAAISKMAVTASAVCPQTTPGERIECVVDRMAAAVSIKEGQPSLDQTRLEEFRGALDTVAKDKTINLTGKDKVVGLPVLTPIPVPAPTPTPTEPAPAPTPAPVPSLPTATPTQLAATKALFSSLRTNMQALGEGDAFRTTSDAIKADLTGTVAPLATDAGGLASLTVSAIDLLDSIRAGRSFWTRVEVSNNQVRNSPTIGFFTIANGEGSCEITQSPLSMNCSVIQNAVLPGTTATFMAGTRVYATRTFKLEPKAGSASDYSYTAFLEKHVLKYEGMTTVGTPTREPIGDAFSGEITFARSGGNLTQLSVKGRMPGRLGPTGALDSDYEDWLLDVTRTMEANNLALYKFGGAFSATKAGQAAGKVEIDNTSFLRVALPATGSGVVPNAANELQVTLRGILADTTISGTLRAAEGKQDKSKTTHVPTRLSFDGWLKHKDATVFSGSVAIHRSGYENFDASVGESATNFVADTVEIGGSLSIPNRPKLSLTVGVTRTGPDTADISVQYRDGTSVINASVSTKVGERHPLVKIASADGVAFSFTSTSVTVPVTKDGAVVAQLDLAKGLITYIDGSTESLK